MGNWSRCGRKWGLERMMASMTDEDIRKQMVPGARVKVTQQIPARKYVWANETRGTVVDYQQKPTGSWYAHSRGDKLWLDRLVVRKDDGEITTLNLDDYSRVEIEAPAPTATEAGAAAE